MSTVAGFRPADIVKWRNAVFIIFFANGFNMASWTGRLPRSVELLHTTMGTIGIVMFGLALGSLVGITIAGQLIPKFGTPKIILVTLIVQSLGLVLAAAGLIPSSLAIVTIGLVITGFNLGCCDVSMNVSGAAAEKAGGKTIMPLFHAFFSFGTVAGAGLSALMQALNVPVWWQVWAVAIIVIASTASVRWLQDERAVTGVAEHEDAPSLRERLAVWKQPQTLLIGLVVLGMAFTEGSANDWLALSVVHDRNGTKEFGALIFAVFVGAMTVGRLLGGRIIDHFGRVPILRATAGIAVVGMLLFIFVPGDPAAIIGTTLWGLGASLGFPVGMSAAADDPRVGAARVSAVSSIGYLAFLVGPPLLGFLADHIGLAHSLLVVLVLTVVSFLATPAARERNRTKTPKTVDA